MDDHWSLCGFWSKFHYDKVRLSRPENIWLTKPDFKNGESSSCHFCSSVIMSWWWNQELIDISWYNTNTSTDTNTNPCTNTDTNTLVAALLCRGGVMLKPGVDWHHLIQHRHQTDITLNVAGHWLCESFLLKITITHSITCTWINTDTISIEIHRNNNLTPSQILDRVNSTP